MRDEQRRVHERAPLEVEVTLESESNFYVGIAGNLSRGGVFVATSSPPARGSEVQLRLKLQGADSALTIRGLVCWMREVSHSGDEAPAGCGIRFLELSEEALTLINAFVCRRDTILFDEA